MGADRPQCDSLPADGDCEEEASGEAFTGTSYGKSALCLVGETDLQEVTVNGATRLMLGRTEGHQKYHRRGRDGAGEVRPSMTVTSSSRCRSEANRVLFRCVGLQIVR